MLAVDLATAIGARIHLVHVCRAPHPGGGFWGASFPVSLAEELEESARTLLANAKRRVSEEGIDVDCELLEGDPAAQIVSCANRIGADWVVMAGRGAARVRSAFLGSVATQTLRTAPCPVITDPTSA